MVETATMSKKISEKDIGKILANYLKYWYLFVIGAVICIAAAFLYLRYKVTPIYRVSGKILLNDKKESSESTGLESLSNLGLIKMSKNMQDEIGVLQSYDLMKITVDELDMAVGYYVKGKFSYVEAYKKALPFQVKLNDSFPIVKYGKVGSIIMVDEFRYKFTTEETKDKTVTVTHNFGEQISTANGVFTVRLNPSIPIFKSQESVVVKFFNVESLATTYNQRLKVAPVDKNGGGLLKISLTDHIPQRGKDVINKLIEVYASKSAEHKNALAKTTLELIDERLELLTGELTGVEKNVETYKQNNNLTNVSSDAARFIELAGEADRELTTVRMEINALSSLEDYMARANVGTPTVVSSYNINNASITNLISSYNQIVQRRKSLLRSTGEGNPLIVEIDRQLMDSRNAISANLSSIKSELSRTERNLLNRKINYNSKISSVPSAERALIEINRDQTLKQKLYLYLLQKREEEALSISAPFSDTRIVEVPRAGNYPINSGKMPVYLGAILFGCFIPFIWIFAKDKFNNKVLSKEHIEDITDNAILGKIASNTGKEVLVVSENNTTVAAEQLRLMRYNLKFLLQGKSDKVIMVTSSKQGEGKTFVTINFGASLAITGKKVVVVGMDLRLPKLMKDIKLPNIQGVSDFIVDKSLTHIDITVPHDKEKNLFFIGAGTIPPNPGELMLNDRITELIETLKEEYDHIILDTPPIGKVADAYSLKSLIDLTIFVVRQNYTTKEDLNIINEINRNKKLNPLMVVLNDVKMDRKDAYSYGYNDSKK